VRTALKWSLVGVVLVMVGLQLVPYGRDHDNPPVAVEPEWPSDETRALAAVACADCHSNDTEWPWYANVAPASWLVQRDVDDGREAWNWSEGTGNGDEAAEVLADGEMPPRRYTMVHTDARLTSRERADLAAGLELTFGDHDGGGDDDRGGDDSGGDGGGGDDSG
jgi:mono/diheme cytochrome c family protein